MLSTPVAELLGAVMTRRHCGTVPAAEAGIAAVPVEADAATPGSVPPTVERLYQVSE